MEQVYFNAGSDFKCNLYFKMPISIVVIMIKSEVKTTKLKAYIKR